MATLLEIYDVLLSDSSQALRNRVMAQCLISANYILNEDPGTANHINRLTWAQAALQSTDALQAASAKMYTGVCTNPTIQGSGNDASDNDIAYVVATLIDTVYAAGITMATTRKWVAYGISKTTIINGDDTAPTLKNLANAAQKCGNEIDNTSNLYQYVDWELHVRFASSPAAGASVSLYLVPAIDGTSYGDGADDSVTPPATCWVGAFPVRAVSTQQRVTLAAPAQQCMIGPGKYKPVIVNTGGQAFTNTDNENILYYRLYNERAV